MLLKTRFTFAVNAEDEATSRTAKLNLYSIMENNRNRGIIQDVTEGNYREGIRDMGSFEASRPFRRQALF
jgi:hypothetical protein